MKTNLLAQKQVAIIGAGPVGLTTARLLQQAGVAVKVYERDLHRFVRVFGGTLDIHKNSGQKALKKAGLLEAFYKLARPTGERLVDYLGNVLMQDFPLAHQLYDRPEIDRNDLRQLLLDHLDLETVVWGKQLKTIEKTKEQFTLSFTDGTTAIADVVIGANGGKSVVRSHLTKAIPQFTGTYIIQGEVLNPEINCPEYKLLCQEDNLMLIEKSKLFFSQVKSKGTLNYFVCFQAAEDFVNKEKIDVANQLHIQDYLKRTLVHWDAKFISLFEATTDFWVLPLHHMPLTEKWVTSAAITLVGDAAHLMPPFAGVGVNIGLLDALHLSENLIGGNFPTLRAAMEAYENEMFVYASKAQRETAAAEKGFFSDQPLESLLQGREEWNKTL